MRFCACERRDFPESEFDPPNESGVVMHTRPGGQPHPVGQRTKGPPPDALRMMVPDTFLSGPDRAVYREGKSHPERNEEDSKDQPGEEVEKDDDADEESRNDG